MKDFFGFKINKKQIISYKYKNRKDIIRGFVLDINNDWTLLLNNAVNYQIDGYKIIRNKLVKKYKQNDHEEFITNALKLKNINIDKKVNINLDNLFLSLQLFPLIQVEFKDETICFIGKILEINNNVIKMKTIDPHGNWDKTLSEYNIKRIRIIEIENDYLKTLLLINKNKD